MKVILMQQFKRVSKACTDVFNTGKTIFQSNFATTVPILKSFWHDITSYVVKTGALLGKVTYLGWTAFD